eukprot:3800368-Pyramimonas_sp.AAC.1
MSLRVQSVRASEFAAAVVCVILRSVVHPPTRSFDDRTLPRRGKASQALTKRRPAHPRTCPTGW